MIIYEFLFNHFVNKCKQIADKIVYISEPDLPRFSRQGAEEVEVVDEDFPDINAIAQAGERCVEKVMMTEETVYDNVIECHHSYDEKCHTTYKTIYDPQQVQWPKYKHTF